MSSTSRNPVLLTMVCVMIAAAPLAAADLGNVRSMSRRGAASVLTTDRGAVVEITFLRLDVFRVRAGAGGRLTDAGDKEAPIVAKTDYPPVEVTVSDSSDHLLFRTAALTLRVDKRPLRMSLYEAGRATPLWQELRPLDIGEKSAVQTLSSSSSEQFMGGGQQNGSFFFKGKLLEISYSGGWEEGDRPSPAPFYMSSNRYGVLRNTWTNGRYDFRSDDYLTAEHAEDRFDAYYFAGDIKRVLAAYTELTGRAPLLPRWAYEYGDADCYNDGDNVRKPGTVPAGWSDGPTGTTPDVIDTVARKYRQHDMPGGWILPNDGYGCGYTDLPRVVEELKKLGFHTGLWTENGVEKIAWEVETAGTRVQKLDVAWTGKGYQFAMDANKAAADGILQNSDSRPFLWTVMGWAGIQRYAVTWTGDQSGSFNYIRWHVPTLIGSGLSGQFYATGDVDGIFGGSPETYTRDLQWKSFTPVLMGMSGWSSAERKHPWWFDEPYRSINRKYLALKMRLMPYMYTLAAQAEKTGEPIVRGLMWDHPDDPDAFTGRYNHQFFLGADLLIAPVFRSQAASNGWRENIHLPKGRWIDYWDGTVVDAGEGGRDIDVPVTLEKIPVLVHAGAILPMYPAALYDGQVPKDVLTLDIYPQGNSEFVLYEDDGNTREYKGGASSMQRIAVAATLPGGGDVRVDIDGARGQYKGMEKARGYELWVHTRVRPDRVTFDGTPLRRIDSADSFASAASGWYFDAKEKYGTLFVRSARVPVGTAHAFRISVDGKARPAATPGYPAMPPRDRGIPSDQIMVLGRPAEEPGHVVENMFDGRPDTWFRTKRDLSLKTGPHEFTLAFGERRLIEGFDIAPRNDKNWRYGQVKDYEVYLSDRNGEWGSPVNKGRLEQRQEMQHVEFPPKAGSLLRFRVLTTWDMDEEQELDPMVTAARGGAAGGAFNALVPKAVSPIVISEFRVREARPPNGSAIRLSLSDATPEKQAGTASSAAAGHELHLNGLTFRKGIRVSAGSRLDYALSGDWTTLRGEIGIDDSCRSAGGLQFQVWGDERLLYDSGTVTAPEVLKPEIDVRGIRTLSLRTTGGSDAACGDWADLRLTGYEGARVGGR